MLICILEQRRHFSPHTFSAPSPKTNHAAKCVCVQGMWCVLLSGSLLLCWPGQQGWCSSPLQWPRLRSGWVCADARVLVAQTETPEQSWLLRASWHEVMQPLASPCIHGLSEWGWSVSPCQGPSPRPCGMGFKPLTAVSSAKCRSWENAAAGEPCSAWPVSPALCISFSLRPRLWLA